MLVSKLPETHEFTRDYIFAYCPICRVFDHGTLVGEKGRSRRTCSFFFLACRQIQDDSEPRQFGKSSAIIDFSRDSPSW